MLKKWNEQAAPNNNLSAADIKNSNLPKEHEFSEELSDGMERNETIETFQNNRR